MQIIVMEQNSGTIDEGIMAVNEGRVGGVATDLNGIEDDSLDLTFALEEDLNRKDQLLSFWTKEPPTTKRHRPSEQQLLQEGKLGESIFTARLQLVKYGLYRAVPACLILFQVNFSPKNRGFFRFRDAQIEVEFEHGSDDQGNNSNTEDEGAPLTRPLVRQFYPKLIRGHVQTAADEFSWMFTAAPPVTGVTAEVGVSSTSPREGLHLIEGLMQGDPHTGVRWRMLENEVDKGGIYEQPVFAVIVQHEQRRFLMSLKLKATTWGGVPVKGRGGSRIVFEPGRGNCERKTHLGSNIASDAASIDLFEGSIDADKQARIEQGALALRMLDKHEQDYLEKITDMKAELLGEHGPGARAQR